MTRLIVALSLAVAATTAASAAVPAAAAQRTHVRRDAHRHVARAVCKVAPADEYFGRMKMSILGIRNTIKDQGLKIDADPTKEPDTRGAIALTEDAVRDWQRKYPCDNWIPTTLYALEHFYAKIHTEDGVRHVHATYAWLRHAYPHAKVVADGEREDEGATATPAVQEAEGPR